MSRLIIECFTRSGEAHVRITNQRTGDVMCVAVEDVPAQEVADTCLRMAALEDAPFSWLATQLQSRVMRHVDVGVRPGKRLLELSLRAPER